jgi:hypothetical protein
MNQPLLQEGYHVRSLAQYIYIQRMEHQEGGKREWEGRFLHAVPPKKAFSTAAYSSSPALSARPVLGKSPVSLKRPLTKAQRFYGSYPHASPLKKLPRPLFFGGEKDLKPIG